jgi:ABC-type multidrug transport system fused ATPase/permease subunit
VSLRRVGRLFSPYCWQLAIVTTIIAASSVVGVASPFLLRAVLDTALPDKNVRLLVLLVAGMIGIAAVTSAFGVIQTWISTKVGQRVMHGLRTSVFGHLQRQSVAFFTRTRAGEVQSRITNDIGGMESVVTSTATSIAANLTTAVATAVAMAALSWQLSLISLVVMPPAIYLSRKVARLYDPTSGSVRIDGLDIRDIRLADLAAIVGVVSQETYLLHTTVRENLRYAKPEATDTEIANAARAAQIHDLIAGLPDGYDTMVGSRGHRFSGGEKQRIAIARTLLRDPRVLVLDEATSALDTETERAVQTAFDNLAAGRTTITIAHRLSTVRNADQIAVLDHGHITESGTHTSLLTGNGRYAALAA